MERMVIVIDMLRGFLEDGHPLYCGIEAREIIPNMRRLLKDMQAEDVGESESRFAMKRIRVEILSESQDCRLPTGA